MRCSRPRAWISIVVGLVIGLSINAQIVQAQKLPPGFRWDSTFPVQLNRPSGSHDADWVGGLSIWSFWF